MHKKGALLLLISLIIVVIISIVWEDEKPDATPIPIENTTEVISQTDTLVQEEKRFKLERKQEIPAVDTPKEELSIDKIPAEETNISATQKATHTFTLVNTKNESHQVTLSDHKITFQQNEKPIVMLNLFATWCQPCIGQIAYFHDLQKKYQKELFVAGILTHDNIDKSSLETFMAKQQINYFIFHTIDNDAFASLLANELRLDENFSIPLTVIYVDGEYFTHYEGIVPVEMIEYDIQQAKKQLKSR